MKNSQLYMGLMHISNMAMVLSGRAVMLCFSLLFIVAGIIFTKLEFALEKEGVENE